MDRFLLVILCRAGWAVLIPAFMICGCSVSAARMSPSADGSVTAIPDRVETVVFPAAQAADFVYALTGETVQGGWTPGKAELDDLDRRLLHYIGDAQKEDALRPISAYKRHAAGYTADGQTIILANYFCNPLGIDWKTSPLLVLDGGNCYFQVKYNRDSNQIIELMINGES